MEIVKPDQQGQPEHSPKLKMAGMEIKAILEKYDIAGVAHLHLPGFNEYVIHISPSFSCVEINEQNKLRIHPPLEDPLNPNAHKKKIADTVNMIANMKMHQFKLSQVLSQADIAVRSQFGMMPKPGQPKPPFPTNGKA